METYLAFVSPASCANRTSVRKNSPPDDIYITVPANQTYFFARSSLYVSPVEHEAPLLCFHEKAGLERRRPLGLLPSPSGSILGALQAVCGGAGEGGYRNWPGFKRRDTVFCQN